MKERRGRRHRGKCLRLPAPPAASSAKLEPSRTRSRTCRGCASSPSTGQPVDGGSRNPSGSRSGTCCTGSTNRSSPGSAAASICARKRVAASSSGAVRFVAAVTDPGKLAFSRELSSRRTPGNAALVGRGPPGPTAVSSRFRASASSTPTRSTNTRVANNPRGSQGCTRTGSKIPSSPEGSLANATRHSDSANRDPKYAEDNTAIVRPADSVACCIWCMKSAPGRKSNACTTVV